MKAENPRQRVSTATPDFRAKTINTLARRAAFLCSNPDCRVGTVGPSSDPQKSTTIGEAAHIFGARPASKRFRENMTDGTRAAITNGIWLCRNCHKQVDADENRYTSDLLFAWREQHERYVLRELGNSADRFLSERQEAILEQFASYPALVRRIVIDKPNGWEWRLTAELLRYLNAPLFRRLSDLRQGHCAARQEHLSEEQALDWVQQRFAEMSRLMVPLRGLVRRLNQSWGEPGEPGSVEEIHHVCKLLNASLEQIIQFEERVYFTNGPESYRKALELLRDFVGPQAEKLAEIPDFMDELIVMSESEPPSASDQPRKIEKVITFEAPEEQLNDLIREIRRAEGAALGCLTTFATVFLPLLLEILV